MWTSAFGTHLHQPPRLEQSPQLWGGQESTTRGDSSDSLSGKAVVGQGGVQVCTAARRATSLSHLAVLSSLTTRGRGEIADGPHICFNLYI